MAGTRRWGQVVSPPRLSHYAGHARRGQAAGDAIGRLPAFTGRRIHDGWGAYWRYQCQHGLCHAPHLRALAAAREALVARYRRSRATLRKQAGQALRALERTRAGQPPRPDLLPD